jgi:hypothetical protein
LMRIVGRPCAISLMRVERTLRTTKPQRCSAPCQGHAIDRRIALGPTPIGLRSGLLFCHR